MPSDEQRHRERQFKNAEGGDYRARNSSGEAGVADHSDFIDVSGEQLGNEPVIEKDGGKCDTRDRMNQPLADGLLRGHILLEPQTQSIEAPRSRPADQRTEDQSVEIRAYRAEACSVVIPGHESNSVLCRNVFP